MRAHNIGLVFMKNCQTLSLNYHQISLDTHLIGSSEGECGGLVVESLTPYREVRGSIPTSAVLCT